MTFINLMLNTFTKKTINFKIFYYIVIVSYISISCSNDDDIIVQNSISNIMISTGDLIPEFDKSITDYYITSLNTLNDIEISIDNLNNSNPIYINGNLSETSTSKIKLINGQDIVISTFDDNGENINYTIHYLPEDLPKANLIINNNPREGLIFVNLIDFSITQRQDFTYIAILNNEGFPVYYKKLPYQGVINFNYFDIGNNQKRFSYNISDIGKIVVMNEEFEEINQLALLPNNNHGAYPSDNHDFIYFSDNHYILPAYVNRENVDLTSYGGSDSVTLIDFVFQEIKNGEVIFEWNSANYPEILEAIDPIYLDQYNSNGLVDYFHFNSFSIDPIDNNFIVSARHTNQIYKIDRISGEIIWRLGGNSSNFDLTENEIFSHQHHVSVTKDGTLILFDNGVTKNQQTRIIEFDLDETNYTIDIVNEYLKDGLYMDIMGSVQKLDNDNFFIGWGGNITSQLNASRSDITEIDSDGNILLEISFTNNSDRFTYSYRALKYNITF